MKNIIFLVIDCLGNEYVTRGKRDNLPYLRELFSSGVSFSQAIATASTTTPSIASMLTGCYPFRHGMLTLGGNIFSDSAATLPEVLKKLGYNTYAEVTGPLYPEMGFSRCFDVYRYRDKSEYLSTGWGEDFRKRLSNGFFREPWVLFLHVWELHHPRHVLPAFRSGNGAPYEKALASLDHTLKDLLGNVLDLSDTLLVLTGDHGEQIERNPADLKMKKSLLKGFDRLCNLGLFRGLRRPVYRKLLVGHGYDINEKLVRVPLLMAGGGMFPEGAELDAQVSHVDILPTLLSLTGAEHPGEEDFDGRSLLPIISGEETGDRTAYMQASGIVLPDPSTWLEGIRYRGMKYVRYQCDKDDRAGWVYDLEHDPGESVPLHDEALLKDMKSRMEELKSRCSGASRKVNMTEGEMSALAEKLKDLGYI